MIFESSDNALDHASDFLNAVVKDRFQCTRVSFDISKIKKLQKVYNIYKIPEDERILAFCKGNLPLVPITMDGVVFTNRALYFYTSSGTQYISYASLSRFIIAHDGAKGKVFAYSENDGIEIYRGTLLSQNVAGIEITRILNSVQEELCSKNPVAQSERDALVQGFLDQATKGLQTGGLTNRLNAILCSLILLRKYSDNAATVKAEYIFRECDTEKYRSFMDELSGRVSDETYAKLKKIPQDFTSRYIETITDLNLEYEEDALSKAYKNLRHMHPMDKQYRIIQAFIGVRKEEVTVTNKRIAGIRESCGDASANQIEWFKGIYGYSRMQMVYKKIINKEELPVECIRYRDGLGLTPLHYALIMKDEQSLSWLLKKATWLQPAPIENSPEVDALFDYILLAHGKQLADKENLLCRAHTDTYEAAKRVETLKNRIKAAMVKLELQKGLFEAQKRQMDSMRRNHADPDMTNELADKMEEHCWRMNDSLEEIRALDEELQEEKIVLKDTITDVVENALKKLASMGCSNDPFEKYLYRVFFEPNFFEQVVAASRNPQDLCMYKNQNFFFIAPRFVEIPLPIVDINDIIQDENTDEQESNNTVDHPIYGASWFSPEAHHNITALKTEYRKLAKAFHPDVSKHPDSNKLFQMISVEYNDILKQLGV